MGLTRMGFRQSRTLFHRHKQVVRGVIVVLGRVLVHAKIQDASGPRARDEFHTVAGRERLKLIP